MNCRKLLLGVLASLAIAPVAHAQHPPASSRPKPQKPLEVPPAVVVLQVDTTAGDSTRVIIQRDLDYGDRLQPLFLDSTALADIWQPWSRKINFDPLAQTRANFVVRARPMPTGLHVEVYDARGKLRQEGDFRLPRVPANRLTIIRDSIAKALARKTQVAIASLIADSVARDTLARAAAKPAPNKTTRDRANARRAQVVRDSISADLNRRDVLLRTSIARKAETSRSRWSGVAVFHVRPAARRVISVKSRCGSTFCSASARAFCLSPCWSPLSSLMASSTSWVTLRTISSGVGPAAGAGV